MSGKHIANDAAIAGPSRATGKSAGSASSKTQPTGSKMQGSTGFTATGIVANTINVNIIQSSVAPSPNKNLVTRLRCTRAPIPNFEGRQELLKLVHEKLQNCLSKDHYLRRIVALVGMGGMGKTETARKFAHQYREHYTNVAWIEAETEYSTRKSFRRIAKMLRLPCSSDDNGRELAELVYDHLSLHTLTLTLFIFDDANQLKTDGDAFGIFDYLPKRVVEGLPLVLVTSRMTEWRRFGCETVEITELNPEESLNFFLSEFQLSRKKLREDSDLRDLLESLLEGLDGYPLALNVAAANIPYIPGQDSLEFLKMSLRSYIKCMGENKILEQRVDVSTYTDYPYTMLIVWDIALNNLQKTKHGHEARFLLDILAYWSQKEIQVSVVRRVYENKIENFELVFPRENDLLSFEEALHVLQIEGLVKVEGRGHTEVVTVNRLIQALARHSDDTGLGIQNLIIFNLHPIFDPVGLRGEYLLLEEGIPSWALENERKALLWLQALQYVLGYELSEKLRNDLWWKKQLERFPNGAYVVVVAEFIVENKVPIQWPGATGWDSDMMWMLITNAMQVRSSLFGSSLEIRVLLELLVLSVVARSVKITCKCFCEEPRLHKSLKRPDSAVLDGFKGWLSDFDFLTAIAAVSYAEGAIDFVVMEFIKLSRLIASEVNLVEPIALLRVADAKSAHCEKQEQWKISTNLINRLYNVGLGRKDRLEELVRNYTLLDHIASSLTGSTPDSGIQMLQEILLTTKCAPFVLQHKTLMNAVTGGHLWRREDSPLPSENSCIKVCRPSEDLKAAVAGSEGGLEFAGSWIWQILRRYRLLLLLYAITLARFDVEIPVWKTLAEILPKEKWMLALETMSNIGYAGIDVIYSTVDLRWFLDRADCAQPLCLETYLETDIKIINDVSDRLQTHELPSAEGNAEEIWSVLQSVRRFNQVLSELIKNPEQKYENLAEIATKMNWSPLEDSGNGEQTFNEKLQPQPIEKVTISGLELPVPAFADVAVQDVQVLLPDAYEEVSEAAGQMQEKNYAEHQVIYEDDKQGPFRMVDPPTSQFTGRKELLAILHQKLQKSSSEMHFIHRMVVLAGMTGMGKSETAKMLAQEYKQHYENVAWIYSETETSVKESFLRLCALLCLPHSDSFEGKELAALVYQHFADTFTKPVLIIFDNANGLNTDANMFGIYEYLPAQTRKDLPLVLVTSNTAEWRRYGCEVVDIPSFNESESIEFLISMLSIIPNDLRSDRELQGLLKTIAQEMEGCPLGLALAVGSISLIPGEHSLVQLKQELHYLISLINSTRRLESPIDASWETAAQTTVLLKSWGIAIRNLERREHVREAKKLLFILACCKPALDEWIASQMYGRTCQALGVNFPSPDDATFDVALYELKAVGFVRVLTNSDGTCLQTPRHIQTMARLEDKESFGVQKFLLEILSSGLKLDRCEEHLWSSNDTIPNWVLITEQRALLWLCALKLVAPKMNDSRMEAIHRMETAMNQFPSGADISSVTEFLVKCFSQQRYQLHNSDIGNSVLESAMQLKSSLVTDVTETIVILEILLLFPVNDYTEDVIRNLKEHAGIPSGKNNPRPQAFQSLAQWLFHFDYSCASRMRLPDLVFVRFFHRLFRNLAKISAFDPFFRKKCQTLRPQSLCALANAEVEDAIDPEKLTKVSLQLMEALTTAWTICPDDVEASYLIRSYNLLDHISRALASSSPDAGLRILQHLLAVKGCTNYVLQHQALMGILASSRLWQCTNSIWPSQNFFVKLNMPDEEVQKVFPGFKGGLKFEGSSLFMFRIYRVLVVLCTIATCQFQSKIPTSSTLEFPPKEKYELLLDFMNTTGHSYVVTYSTLDLRSFLESNKLHSLWSEAELELDGTFIDLALTDLNGDRVPPHKGRSDDIIEIVQLIQKFNQNLSRFFKRRPQDRLVDVVSLKDSLESAEQAVYGSSQPQNGESSSVFDIHTATVTTDGKHAVKSFWTAAYPIENFVGRQNLLEEIHQKLQGCLKSNSWAGRMVVIVGSEGIGKTELARQFAKFYKAVYKNVAWIHADTAENIRSSFTELAQYLNLLTNKDEDASGRIFKHVCQLASPTLFIFDDAETLHGSSGGDYGVLNYLPETAVTNAPLVLITSQNTGWVTDGITTVHVSALRKEESIKFFGTSMELSNNDLRDGSRLNGLIERLSKSVEGHPLGLQLVVAALKSKPEVCTVSLLERDLEALLDTLEDETQNQPQDGQIGATAEGAPEILRVVWNITKKRIMADYHGPEAVCILQILAYCPADRTNYVDLMEVYLASGTVDTKGLSGVKFGFALHLLTKLAIVKKYTNFQSQFKLQIHNLIQKYVRIDYPEASGLKMILAAGQLGMVEQYLASQSELAIPPSVLGNDEYTIAWLQCLAVVLVGNNTFSRNGHFLFHDGHLDALRSRHSKLIAGILDGVEFLKQLMSYEAEERNQLVEALDYEIDPVTSFRIVQPSVQNFQARRDLIEVIHNVMKECSNSQHWLRRTVALVGVGGMGKSELARKFADVYHNEYPNVAWIDAETKESMIRSFCKVAEVLRIPLRAEDVENDIARQVFRHIDQNIKSSMFIYDNANALKGCAGAFGILDYLPRECQTNIPLTLITSQTAEWRREGIPIIWVRELSLVESVEYFRSQLGLTTDYLNSNDRVHNLILELSGALQGYPLGLQVAATMLNYVPPQVQPEELCKRIELVINGLAECDDTSLFGYEINVEGQRKSLKIVWESTMTRLQSGMYSKAALTLLQILAYCDTCTPSAIAKEVYQCLTHEARKAGETHPFGLASHSLKKLGLAFECEDKEAKPCLEIHPVIQRFAARDDKDGNGLRLILRSKRLEILESYFGSQAKLSIPSTILSCGELTMAWLKCVASALLSHSTLSHGVKMMFSDADKDQLSALQSGDCEAILLTAEFLEKATSEEQVPALLLAAVECATSLEKQLGTQNEILCLAFSVIYGFRMYLFANADAFRRQWWNKKKHELGAKHIRTVLPRIYDNLLENGVSGLLSPRKGDNSLRRIAGNYYRRHFNSLELGQDGYELRRRFFTMKKINEQDRAAHQGETSDADSQCAVNQYLCGQWPELQRQSFSMISVVVIRRAVEKASVPETVFMDPSLSLKLKKWLISLHVMLCDKDHSALKAYDSLSLYMRYATGYILLLLEHKQRQCPISQLMEKWLPASQWLILLPKNLLQLRPIDRRRFKGLLDHLQWDLKADSSVLITVQDVLDCTYGSRDNYFLHCGAIKAQSLFIAELINSEPASRMKFSKKYLSKKLEVEGLARIIRCNKL